MCGFFPPNSKSTLVTFFAPDSITCFPVSAEPVKTIPSTCGSDTSAPPTSAPDPVTILITPFGMPAFNARSPSMIAVRGVISDGFMTAVFPAAIAGAKLLAASAIG